MDPDPVLPDERDTAAPFERGTDPQVRRMRDQEAFEFAPDCELLTNGHGVILGANLGQQKSKSFVSRAPVGVVRQRSRCCRLTLQKGGGCSCAVE